jgi:hypothetical protein
MNRQDWAALGILAVFCAVGSLAPWLRRARVTVLIVLFLGLELHPWVAGTQMGEFIMPFASYRLYPNAPPPVVRFPELRMVTASGAEYEIDFRVWQPHIPRYFNVLLQKRMRRPLHPDVADFLLARVKKALREFHERGHFVGADSYLLGSLHYPEHQSAAWRWRPGTSLPQPEEVVEVRRRVRAALTRPPSVGP